MASHVVKVKVASMMVRWRRGVEVRVPGCVMDDCSFAGFMEIRDGCLLEGESHWFRRHYVTTGSDAPSCVDRLRNSQVEFSSLVDEPDQILISHAVR